MWNIQFSKYLFFVEVVKNLLQIESLFGANLGSIVLLIADGHQANDAKDIDKTGDNQ